MWLPLMAAMLVLVWFDGVAVECLVDTGSTQTLITQQVAARLGTLSPPREAIHLVGVNGSPLQGTMHTIPNMGTQELGWPEGVVIVVPSEDLRYYDCILGRNVLGRQNLTLDWAAGTIRPAP